MRNIPGQKKSEVHSRIARNKRKPPRGMYLQHDDLLSIATGPPGQGEAILKQLDVEIVALKRQVPIFTFHQRNFKFISHLE